MDVDPRWTDILLSDQRLNSGRERLARLGAAPQNSEDERGLVEGTAECEQQPRTAGDPHRRIDGLHLLVDHQPVERVVQDDGSKRVANENHFFIRLAVHGAGRAPYRVLDLRAKL